MHEDEADLSNLTQTYRLQITHNGSTTQTMGFRGYTELTSMEYVD